MTAHQASDLEMRRLETENERVKQQEQTTAQVRDRILGVAQSQRESLATSFDDLLGDGGPSDETADEMIKVIREWRDVPSNRSLD
jgi:hypothetical protein